MLESGILPCRALEHRLQRLDALTRWLERHLGGAPFNLEPASEDAGFRRYFRAAFDGQTRIIMDAPPDKEDCRPFLHVGELLRAAGVHVPRVYAQDLDLGFLLLEDLGKQTFLDVLEEGNASRLFDAATDALVRIQRAAGDGALAPYDEALLRREMNLFPDWYLARHRGITLTPALGEALESVFRLLVESALAQPRVTVHRDFMPRNLMLSDPNPGVIDFQDAVLGPIAYDIVSLTRDAFISWDEERVLDVSIRYWGKARRAGLPVDADFSEFWRAFEWMGLQRHLKVLGIFARLNYRDGKPRYLADTPRFIDYARKVAQRYGPLAPLLSVLDASEGVEEVQVGYTF